MTLPGAGALLGYLYEMNHGRISILLDCRLPLHRTYMLHHNIYRNGKLHQVSLFAQAVNESLMDAQGFKYGFQLDPYSDEIDQALGAILK